MPKKITPARTTSQTKGAPIEVDESKVLILRVIERAVLDLFYPSKKAFEEEDGKYLQAEAFCFFFDNSYRLQWGTNEIAPEELFSYADLSLREVRSNLFKRLDNSQYSELLDIK